MCFCSSWLRYYDSRPIQYYIHFHYIPTCYVHLVGSCGGQHVDTWNWKSVKVEFFNTFIVGHVKLEGNVVEQTRKIMYELYSITTLVIRQVRQVVGQIRHYLRITEPCPLGVTLCITKSSPLFSGRLKQMLQVKQSCTSWVAEDSCWSSLEQYCF